MQTENFEDFYCNIVMDEWKKLSDKVNADKKKVKSSMIIQKG